MTGEQAQKEYEQLLNRTVAEKRRIEEEAKRNGTWKAGLDSNNHLFSKIDSEFANKVKEIQSKVEACMPITIPKHEPIKKVYVELVREIVESEAKNDEDAE